MHKLSPQLLHLLLLLAFVVACPDNSASNADAEPSDTGIVDHPPPDRAPFDYASCPSLDLGEASTATGWKVAQLAGVDLHAMACVKGHVYIAGAKGTLLHKDPNAPACGGFIKQKVPTDKDLYTVSFADLSYGVTAGEGAQIWQTKDQGKTWTEAPQCGNVVFGTFHSLNLYAADQGYGVGVDKKTGDAAYKVYPGTTWICPDQTFPQQILYDTCRFKKGGWMVGDTGGRIYHTPDEGSTWFLIDNKITKALRGVAMTSAMVGVAVGEDGTILRSADGKGLEWSPVKTLGNDDLWQVFLLDDKLGWAVGDGGTLLHTKDSGKTWEYQMVPVTERLVDVCFNSATEGWVVGAKGTILYTATGGT